MVYQGHLSGETPASARKELLILTTINHPAEAGRGAIMKIDQKYLKGLKFRYSEPGPMIPGDENNRVRTYVTMERDLHPEDVLAVKEDEINIKFVTADGQKYTVAR